MTVEVLTPVPELPPDVEAVAYFVCSEALANIAKHAEASRATVTVTSGDGLVSLAIEDDGLGGADPRTAQVSAVGRSARSAGRDA